MKKKLISLLLTLICLFCVCTFAVGCGDETTPSDTAEQTADVTTPTIDKNNGTEHNGQTNTIELSATVAKTYFNQLTQSFTASPYAFIPAAMLPDYKANSVTETEITYDFTDFVNVSEINYGGFGRQWNMILDNITQSEFFYKYLNKGNSVISSAFDLINEYFNSDKIDTLNKSFEKGAFTAAISYKNKNLNCTVNYKSSITNSLFGNISPKISMTYNTASKEKIYDITITDTNRMHYVVTEDKYEFGIEYGVEIGQRTSYLSIEKKDARTEGHIYEYITLKGKDVMPSCADFYIENGYVSVVGNKADAMMGTKGYINELYKANEGKLLGYEVRETVSGVSYNTLWFNLSDISGITNIKIGDKTKANESGKSTNDVYLNDSLALFAPTYNKKLGVKTSRKYDIEFRTRYFYSTDTETGKITEHEVKIPMMFIQEDNDKDTNFTDYTTDVKNDNGITSAVTLSDVYLDKILSDYDNLIDDFINNKKEMSSVEIKAFIES